MLIPLGTDRDGRRPVIAVPLLIAVNVVAFVAMRTGVASHWLDPASGIDPIKAYVQWAQFDPRHLDWWRWVTSFFTHDPSGAWHIVGNMIFLWAFGKPVESHIGFWRFLGFYLLGGLFANLIQWQVSNTPCIGASGAVFAVAGLFIAFFPRSQTRVFYLFTMSVMYVASVWLIGLFVVIDVLQLLMDRSGLMRSGVGNAAHLGGMLFGVLGGMLLLKLGVVPRGDWDLLYATKQFFRRRQMRAALRGDGPTPWMGGAARGAVTKGGPLDPRTVREAELRALTQSRLRSTDGTGACQAYRELVAVSPESTLHADAQLELANRAMAEGDSPLAAQAYANFLAAYPNDTKANEVRLMLSIVYLRRLQQPTKATPLLQGLPERLHDADQRTLAQALLRECAT